MKVRRDKNERPVFPKLSKDEERMLAEMDRFFAERLQLANTWPFSECDDPDMDAMVGKFEDLYDTRLRALYKFYRVPFGMKDVLISRLARQLVPNFDIENQRKVGRQPRDPNVYGLRFVIAVRKKATERGRGYADAFLQLSKKGEWAGTPKGTLSTRYYEELKNFPAAFASEASVSASAMARRPATEIED